MKQGVVIFAFNNDHIDYVKLAAFNAGNIDRYLGLPVTLITDQISVPAVFDQVVTVPQPKAESRFFDDVGTTVAWRNTNRMQAYELSPYDETIVLDADYVVNSAQLKLLSEQSPADILCHRWARDLTKTYGQDDMSPTFGEHNMPMWWATVMFFRRSNTTQFVFDSMDMIRQNWDHYCNIYKIKRRTYRNDYALSIALGMVSGHTQKLRSIPWVLNNVPPHAEIQRIYEYRYDITWGAHRMQAHTIDLHVMGKRNLGDLIDSLD